MPQDAIHLSTAPLNNIDELHTFDRANLTGLSGKIQRLDGGKLKIWSPPKRPAPAPTYFRSSEMTKMTQPKTRRPKPTKVRQQTPADGFKAVVCRL